MSEKPKRPLSAYMIWLNENRESIKKDHPGIKVTEIAKKGGEMWRGLKDKTVSFKKDKICLLLNFIKYLNLLQEWEQKAAKIKDEYTKAVKEFEANGGSTEKSSNKKRGKQGKKVAKKSKKKESDEDEESNEEESE